MIKILTKVSVPSCKILAIELQSLIDDRVIVTTHSERIRENDLVFRYGNSDDANRINRDFGDSDLNSQEFIHLCSNKKQLSDILLEYNFYAPTFYRWVDKEYTYPVICRNTLSSFGGKGITVVNSEQEMSYLYDGNNWWTDFVKTAFELRVHVLGGKVKRIFKKEYDAVDDSDRESDYPIRNLSNGYHFSLKDNNLYPKVIDLFNRISQIEEIGNDNYYAADIGWDAVKKEYFIFEFNSAPGLNENTAKVYAEFLAERI
jgi:hypothetical protein